MWGTVEWEQNLTSPCLHGAYILLIKTQAYSSHNGACVRAPLKEKNQSNQTGRFKEALDTMTLFLLPGKITLNPPRIA